MSPGKQFHCYTDQCFLCDAMHRKTKGSYVHVSTVSSLAQGGLLVPGYIMQELKAINCAVCEPSRRHCRQGRETLARICINPSKNTSALLAGWNDLLQSICYQEANWEPQEVTPCWGLRVLSFWQVNYSSTAEALECDQGHLDRTLYILHVFPHNCSISGPRSGSGVDNMEADWYHKWVLLCIWSSVFISGIFSLRDTDLIHKDPHTLRPVPLVHPKKSCSDVLVFALIHACLVVQSCLTLYDPDEACQAPLSMGFFQARILEWVAISPSRKSSPPRVCTHISCVSCIAGRFIREYCCYYNITTLLSRAFYKTQPTGPVSPSQSLSGSAPFPCPRGLVVSQLSIFNLHQYSKLAHPWGSYLFFFLRLLVTLTLLPISHTSHTKKPRKSVNSKQADDTGSGTSVCFFIYFCFLSNLLVLNPEFSMVYDIWCICPTLWHFHLLTSISLTSHSCLTVWEPSDMLRSSLGMVKSSLLQKTWTRSAILELCTMTLGLGVLTESPPSAVLEKAMATHSSTLAWKIP